MTLGILEEWRDGIGWGLRIDEQLCKGLYIVTAFTCILFQALIFRFNYSA